MPTYQYACTACKHQLEAVQSFTDDPLTECPVCDGRLRKLFGSVGVVFKGPGFYRTDSRAASNGNGASSNGSGEKEAKGADAKGKGKDKDKDKDSGTSSGGESKPSSGTGSGTKDKATSGTAPAGTSAS